MAELNIAIVEDNSEQLDSPMPNMPPPPPYQAETISSHNLDNNLEMQHKIRNVIAKLSSTHLNSNADNSQMLSEEEIKKKERKQKMNNIRESTLIKVANRNAEIQEQAK